jgi:hypothetical protein
MVRQNVLPFRSTVGNTTNKLRLCKRACFEESHFYFTKKQNFKRKRKETKRQKRHTHTNTERQKDKKTTKKQNFKRKRKETNRTIPDCGKGVPLDLRMNKS